VFLLKSQQYKLVSKSWESDDREGETGREETMRGKDKKKEFDIPLELSLATTCLKKKCSTSSSCLYLPVDLYVNT
jgi:hypothetical protein